MHHCSDLCSKLQNIRLDCGKLPYRDDLISQLPAPNRDGEWYLGTWGELQQRLQCGFCQLVVAATADDNDVNNFRSVDPAQAISILIFPDEQSFRLSYPSRLGTRLAFVTGNGVQGLSPDTARPIDTAGIQTSTIRNWLHACCASHDACSAQVPDLQGKVRLPIKTSMNDGALTI
jgi:hypothetical protein